MLVQLIFSDPASISASQTVKDQLLIFADLFYILNFTKND